MVRNTPTLQHPKNYIDIISSTLYGMAGIRHKPSFTADKYTYSCYLHVTVFTFYRFFGKIF